MSRKSTTSRDPRISRTAPRRPGTAARLAAASAGPVAGTSTLERTGAQQIEALDPLDQPPVDAGDGFVGAGPPDADPAAMAGPSARRRATRTDRVAHRSQSPTRAPRHRMLLVCTAVLAVGLFGVLLLNTIISQGAFRQHELEIDLILTAEKEEALARKVQQAESPLQVERKARALGMVPAAAPVFLRLSDGKVLGEPVPAPLPTAPVSFADAPGLIASPKPSAAPTSAPSDPAAEAGTITPVTPADAVVPTPAPSTSGATTSGATILDPALDPATGLDQPATGAAAPTPAPSTPSNLTQEGNQ